jgi:hypothetical protein
MVDRRFSIKAFKVDIMLLQNLFKDVICWEISEKAENRYAPRMPTRSKSFSNNLIRRIIDEIIRQRANKM